MTTPLVLKAFNLIEKENHYSYQFLISWDQNERKLTQIKNRKKLIPWYLTNIVFLFLLHFCLPMSLLVLRRRNSSSNAPLDNKTAFQLGVLVMMMLHSTANIGINFILFMHAHTFVPFYNVLLDFETGLRGYFITSKDIRGSSMRKELNPKKLSSGESDVVGLTMLFIIHTLTVVPAITPLSLVMEDVDPVGILMKDILLPDYDSLSASLKLAIAVLRIAILTLVMIEISQTFRTVFNFGMSTFHIVRKCLEVSYLQEWSGRATLVTYNRFRIVHSGIVDYYSQLAAFFLSLNFIILTISFVLCLVSHRILPIQIYLGIPAATAMALLLLLATLPQAIHCHEESQKLILRWHRGITYANLGTLRYWKRVLKTLKPIAFYLGNTGVLTQDTKRVYFASIIDGSVNILLWRDSMS